MTPQLKAQDCFDHDPIEAWEPPDATNVNYWLCLHIGPAGERGQELFEVNVLTETAARRLPASELARRKKIVVSHYSWSAVMRVVDDILRQVEGPDWDHIAQQLAKKFNWEFAGYRPYDARA